ncbi:MAG: FlgD immunoglobulin-like domain containing protein, partial [Fidelibacterota bacterium]
PTAFDPEDSTLTIQYLYGPSWLQFQGDSIAGAPGEGQLDTSFSFRITDGDLFDALEVQVQVTPVNDQPVITMPDTLVFTEHLFQLYPLQATDPEDSTLFWMMLDGPSWISLTGDSIGGAPPEGAVDSILSLMTSDGDLSDVQTFVLDIIPVNDPPALTSPLSTTATEDVLYEYLASASDPEGASVSISILNPPVWCSVDGASLSGVPTEGHLDTVFTVRISDSQSVVDYSVPILVTPVNDAPVIMAPDTIPVIYNQYFTYHVPVIDPEDSTLNYQFFSLASWLASAGDSLFGMPTLANSDTVVQFIVDDGEYVDEKTVFLDLQYAAVVSQITMDFLSGEFHGSIPLTVRVDSQLVLSPDSLNWAYSRDALNWLPATVSGGSNQRTLQDTFQFTWHSDADLVNQYEPQIWLRTVLDSLNPAQVAVIGPLGVDNFTGRITVHDISDGQTFSNQVDIPFQIDDPTGDEHTIVARYLLVDSPDGWQPCTTPDSGLSYGPQQYLGIFPWASNFDLVNLDTLVLVALNIFDGWELDQGDTFIAHIDNQVLPLLSSSGQPELAWSDPVRLTFSKPLDPATITSGFSISTVTGNYSGFGLDLSTDERTVSIQPDTGSWAGMDTLRINILTSLEDQLGNPFDGNQNGDPDGPADELTLTFTTYPTGDFDGDNAITFPDLVQFQQGWWAETVAPGMDLGPALGVPPHLQPVLDDKIDFEDLMVFVQMWNWSGSQSRTLARLRIPKQTGDTGEIQFSVRYPQRKPGDPTDETFLELETQDIPGAGALEGILQYDSGQLEFQSLSSSLPEGWIVLKQPTDSQVYFILADFNRHPVELNPVPCRFRFKVLRDEPADIRWQANLFDRTGAVLLQLSGSRSFDPLPDLPQEFALRPNYPNPFNPVTRIEYNLPEDIQVKITVYDLMGKEVRILVDERKTAGFQSTRWDGRDSAGRSVASGLYLVSMSAGKWSAVRKVMLLK